MTTTTTTTTTNDSTDTTTDTSTDTTTNTTISTKHGRTAHTIQTSPTTHRDPDAGFTLIELLLVVLILGILASVVVFAVSDTRTSAAESGCLTDRRVVATAVEAYIAQHGNVDIPATGTGHDQFEQTLVDAGVLRGVSEYYDVAADGALTPEADSGC